jgi:hypothetical protein
MNDWIIVAGLIILFLLVIFIVPQLMIAIAAPKVIKIFRNKNAVGPKNAMTAADLGLQPPSMIARMMKPRDYKPRALQLLMHINVVQMTDDGKIYLSEQELQKTRWNNL